MRAFATAAFCFMGASFLTDCLAAGAVEMLRSADRFADAGNWAAARDLYAEAEMAFRKQGDARNELYAKFGRMHRDVEEGSYSQVAREIRADLARPVVQNDPNLKMRALSLKGNIDLNLNTAEAKNDYSQIRDIARSIGDAKWENRANGELGIIAGANGDLGTAGVALFGAIAKAAALHDLAAQLTFSIWLANGMAVNGLADRALKIVDRAIEEAGENPDAGIPIQLYIAKIRSLVNLPDGPQKNAGVKEAETLIDEALVTARKSHTLGAQSELLNQAGLLAERKSDLPRAAARFLEAEELAKRADLARMQAETLYHLAEVDQRQQKFSEAESAINAAIALQTRVQEAFDLPLYLTKKAEVESALNRPAIADRLYVQATDLIEGMLLNTPSSLVKGSLIATMGDVYLGHFRLALLTLANPAQAFQIVEQARGRALADSLLSSRIPPKTPAATDAGELAIARLQGQLRRPSNTEAQTKHLLAQLEQAYDALVPVEYTKDRAEVVQLSAPVDVKTIQKSLRVRETLLEYVLSNDKHSYVFELTSQAITVHPLPSRDEIEKLTQNYVRALRAKQDPTELARTLFKTVVAPALTTHPDSVTIVPDGSLHLVPFAALRDETDQYWMKSVQISSIPSATVLQRLRSNQRPASPTLPFLGVAFSPAQANQIAAKGSATRTASFGDHPLDLRPLPYAQQEVAAAAQLFGNGSVQLTGDRASEELLKSQPLSEFRIIHFAAHGISDLVEPDRSGLLLAVENGGDDGFWQAREIRRSHLTADLVTLSACATGIGRIQGEEGVTNLARNFLVAGAKSVVASLWEADDRFTATLMSHFYKHVALGETVAESLRGSQMEMLAEFGGDTKPYFWAGFTVIGDGTRKISK
jgi:CHAT domain-containing protein